MSEVTAETFREAAIKAGERLRGETDESSSETVQESLRDRIKDILEQGNLMEEDPIREVSARTAAKIAEMLWPERALEIKKEKAKIGVEQQAFLEYIKDVLREMA